MFSFLPFIGLLLSGGLLHLAQGDSFITRTIQVQRVNITNPHPSSSVTQGPKFASKHGNCSFLIKENVFDYAISYIISYNVSPPCDVFGPICQPGFIIIGVILGECHYTFITVPCSWYPASQSTYLSGFKQPDHPGAIFPHWPAEWSSGFCRSPQCRSFASVYQEGPSPTWTFSGCPTNEAIGTIDFSKNVPLPSQIPPRVLRKETFGFYQCCGNC